MDSNGEIEGGLHLSEGEHVVRLLHFPLTNALQNWGCLIPGAHPRANFLLVGHASIIALKRTQANRARGS